MHGHTKTPRGPKTISQNQNFIVLRVVLQSLTKQTNRREHNRPPTTTARAPQPHAADRPNHHPWSCRPGTVLCLACTHHLHHSFTPRDCPRTHCDRASLAASTTNCKCRYGHNDQCKQGKLKIKFSSWHVQQCVIYLEGGAVRRRTIHQPNARCCFDRLPSIRVRTYTSCGTELTSRRRYGHGSASG